MCIIWLQVEDDKNKSVIFYKSAAKDLIEEDSVNNLNIITLTSSAAESLYLILKQIYSPLLAMVRFYFNKSENIWNWIWSLQNSCIVSD